MARNGTTVREVADRAGVSIATVSRVARGIGQVAPDTRRRVLSAIDDLGYRPSHLGRALVERRHAALGIVFPGLSGPYYTEVIGGFESEAIAARQSVLILGTHLLGHSDDQVMEIATRVDGLAIFGGTVATTSIQRLVASGLPTVLLASPPLAGASSVRSENRAAARHLTGHLLRVHGYRRIVFVGNPDRSPDVTERWRGFSDAFRDTNLEPPAEPVRSVLDQAAGLRAAADLLDADDPPRAMVCANDETAFGAYKSAAARGVRIPEDLAITGWDDLPLAELVSPPLTTVRQPMRELGALTARRLLAGIRHADDYPPDVVLNTELIIRASCGCREGASAAAGPPGSAVNADDNG